MARSLWAIYGSGIFLTCGIQIADGGINILKFFGVMVFTPKSGFRNPKLDGDGGEHGT